MALEVDYNHPESTFFLAECILCRQSLNPENVDSFLAVSSCHPCPGRAVWKEEEGLQLLCIGRVAASKVRVLGELPSIYLVHSCCSAVIALAKRRRTVFECFRALNPVLRTGTPPTLRAWPWSSSCAVYAPALRKVLLEAADAEGSAAEAACLKILQAKIQMRLYAVQTIKERLPLELLDMILDYLPFELALALDSLSKGSRCLRRLRRDPIAHRFERAFEVLGHDLRTFDRTHRRIQLAPKMSAQFVSIGGRWYLQHMAPAATQTGSDQILAGQTRQLLFEHTVNRTPYVAVQVDSFGITHVALDSQAGQPQWISPNKVDKQPTFFQDSSTDKRFDSVAVILDVSTTHRPDNLPY